MTLDKAEKIVFTYTYYCEHYHDALFSVFASKIPESYLPYSQKIIMEAINIFAKHCHNVGKKEYLKALGGVRDALLFYEKDEVAFQWFAEKIKDFKNPKMKNVQLLYIDKFKKSWMKKYNEEH